MSWTHLGALRSHGSIGKEYRVRSLRFLPWLFQPDCGSGDELSRTFLDLSSNQTVGVEMSYLEPFWTSTSCVIAAVMFIPVLHEHCSFLLKYLPGQNLFHNYRVKSLNKWIREPNHKTDLPSLRWTHRDHSEQILFCFVLFFNQALTI